MRISAFGLAAAALCTAAPSVAATVDFSGQSAGYQTNPLTIGNATFATSGFGLFVGDFGNGTGNSICATETGISCDAALAVSFANPVSGFSFLYAGVDSASATIGVVLGFVGGGSTVLSFTPISSNSVIDLTSYDNVLSAEITSSDSAGLNYDTFTFVDSVAVPEPATWAMLILGFGALGSAMRRRSSAGRASGIAVGYS